MSKVVDMSFYDEMRAARANALRTSTVQTRQDAVASERIINEYIGRDASQQLLRAIRKAAKQLYADVGSIARLDVGYAWRIPRDITSCNISTVEAFLSHAVEQAFAQFMRETAGNSKPIHVKSISTSMAYSKFCWATCSSFYSPDGEDPGDPYEFTAWIRVGFNPPIT